MLACIIDKKDRGKGRTTNKERQKYHSFLFSSRCTFATHVKGNTGHDNCITSKNSKRIEFFVLSQSSSWLSSTNCKTNKLLVKFQISAFSTLYYQICLLPCRKRSCLVPVEPHRFQTEVFHGMSSHQFPQ